MPVCNVEARAFTCACAAVVAAPPCVCSASGEVPPVNSEAIRRAMVAGGFLNIARRTPSPEGTAVVEYETLVGHYKVQCDRRAAPCCSGVATLSRVPCRNHACR